MKIVVLIHAKNAQLLETYLSKIVEKEDCVVRKEPEGFTVKINSDVIEFLTFEFVEQYSSNIKLWANIVFYPGLESDRIFRLVAHGFNVRNLNTIISQPPFLGYNENSFIGMMKEKVKYGLGF